MSNSTENTQAVTPEELDQFMRMIDELSEDEIKELIHYANFLISSRQVSFPHTLPANDTPLD